MRIATLSCGAMVVGAANRRWLFGAPIDVEISLKEAGIELPEFVFLTSLRAPGYGRLSKPVPAFKEQPLRIDGLSAQPVKHKHGTDFSIEADGAKVLFSERGDVSTEDVDGYDLAIIKNKSRATEWGDNVIIWPWPDAEFDVAEHQVQPVEISLKIYSKIEDAPENMKTLHGANLTLEQINWIARVADGIPKDKIDNPWAVAKAQFQKSYRKEGDHWVERKGKKEKEMLKDEVDYRLATNEARCGNCANIIPAMMGEETATCRIVDGEIMLENVCNSYMAMEGAAAVAPETPVVAADILLKEAEVLIREKVIRHVGDKWILFTKDGKKKLGEFDTEEDAVKRERQIQFFKHKKGKSEDKSEKPFVATINEMQEVCPDCAEAMKSMGIEYVDFSIAEKAGNISGLAKHLAKKYGGDPGFFTSCMAASEVADYEEDNRAAICARAHKLALGVWPGEGRKGKKGEKKEKEYTEEGPVRRLGDAFIAALHTAYNDFADSYYSQGFMNQDERLVLGKAIGDGLDAVRAAIPEELNNRPLDVVAEKSLNEELAKFRMQFSEQYPSTKDQWRCLLDVEESANIAYIGSGDSNFAVSYTVNEDGSVTFAPESDWTKAIQRWTILEPLNVPAQLKELAPTMPDTIVAPWHTVYKSEDGQWRWVNVTGAMWDKQKEYFAPEAMKWAVDFAKVIGAGPLRYKHIAGLDGGDCDKQVQVGDWLFEAGSFKDSPLGQAMRKQLESDPTWQISPGLAFSRKDMVAGRYKRAAIFERSMTRVPAIPATAIMSIDGGETVMKELTKEELKQVAKDLELDISYVETLHQRALENAGEGTGIKEFKEFVMKEKSKKAPPTEGEEALDEEDEEAMEDQTKQVKEVLASLTIEQRKELKQLMDETEPVEERVERLEEAIATQTKAIEALAAALTTGTKDKSTTDVDEILASLPRKQAAQFLTKQKEEPEADVSDDIILQKLEAIKSMVEKQQNPFGQGGGFYDMFTSPALNKQQKVQNA